MNLLKIYKPRLLVDKDGGLYIEIKLGGVTVIRPTPADIKSYPPQELHDYFMSVVPQMLEELKVLRKDKLKKLTRKGRHESKKRRQHVNGADLSADGGASTAPDGSK